MSVPPPSERILIVDDEDQIRALLARLLGAHGYQCLIAESAAAARCVLEETDVSLVLSDVNMPGESGIDRTAALRDTIAQLESSDAELRRLREETIRRLSWAAEFRNQETGEHIVRMSLYCALLARLAGLDAERTEDIRIASPMHDVGKIGIPDRILLKPGRFTDDERAVMEAHTEMGHGILAGSGVELLDLAAVMALTHHERIDGTGYPGRLTGDAIPIEGRICAVADVFDALTSDRVYRQGFQPDEARGMMLEGRGTQFDAGLLDLFFGSFEDVLAIRRAA